MVDWINEYISIPFADGGRDRYGCDCWGLVRLVLSERYGKHLPSFGGEYASASDAATVSRIFDERRPMVDATRLDAPEEGAVVLMLRRGLPLHVGVMVDARNVLHVERGTDSIVERIDNTRLRSRIEGFYRVN